MMRRRSGRLGKAAPLPTFDELAEADGAEVTDLLREVSRFRLALETDLTIAAAAADAVADHIAPAELSAELTTQAVESGRSALERLVTRRRLDVEAEPSTRRRHGRSGGTRPGAGRATGRRLRRVPLLGAGPLVAAAIVLGLGTGFFASHLGGPSTNQGLSNAASSSLHSLSAALGRGDEQAAREAGNQLSAAIGSLIAAAPDDPAAARAAAGALTAERDLLTSTGGTLGQQLRASMAAQMVALQSTVHVPIATLLTPATKVTPPTAGLTLPLPSMLPPSAVTSLVVLPSLPAQGSPSRRSVATHSPDPTHGQPATGQPVAIPTAPVARPPSPVAPTTTLLTQAPSPVATPSASPITSPSSLTNPLPIGRPGTAGVSPPH